VNAAYKRKLAEEYERPTKPGVEAHRTALAAALLPAVQFALQAGTIRAAWRTAGIEPFDAITTTAHLPPTISTAAAPAGFSISAELLTDAPFLEKWDKYLNNATQEKRKKKKETVTRSEQQPRRSQPPTRTVRQTPEHAEHVEANEELFLMKKEKSKRPPPLTEDEVIQMEEERERRMMLGESSSDESSDVDIRAKPRTLSVIYDDPIPPVRHSYRTPRTRLVDAPPRRSSRRATRIPLLTGEIRMEEDENMDLNSYLEAFNPRTSTI
jgi:hypothetical protein